MPIDWQPIFEKGAQQLGASFGENFGKSFGSALGTAIGGPVGGALAAAILGMGSSHDADLAKIDQRLAAIEEKLDQLTKYMIDVLPTVIYNESLRADIETQRLYFAPFRNDLKGVFAAYLADPNYPNFEQDLSGSMRQLLIDANFLANQGSPFYPYAFAALTAATAVYSQLIKKNAAYEKTLINWSNVFQGVLDKWMDGSDGSVNHELDTLRSVHASTLDVLSQFPTGIVPHCAVMISRPTVMQWPNETTYYYGVVVGYLDRPDGAGGLTGGDFYTYQVTTSNYEAADGQLATLLDQIRAGGGKQIPILIRGYPLMREWPRGWHLGDFRQHLADWYNDAVRKRESLPARIGAGNELVKEINGFRAVARSYANAASSPDPLDAGADVRLIPRFRELRAAAAMPAPAPKEP